MAGQDGDTRELGSFVPAFGFVLSLVLATVPSEWVFDVPEIQAL